MFLEPLWAAKTLLKPHLLLLLRGMLGKNIKKRCRVKVENPLSSPAGGKGGCEVSEGICLLIDYEKLTKGQGSLGTDRQSSVEKGKVIFKATLSVFKTVPHCVHYAGIFSLSVVFTIFCFVFQVPRI